MDNICKDIDPCPLQLKFMACLEWLLCFYHTGNASVLAISLMHPLGLSRGILKDSFPVILDIFKHPTITMAMRFGFNIKPFKWPLKDGYPAIASIKAQVITYLINYFLVHIISLYHYYVLSATFSSFYLYEAYLTMHRKAFYAQ